MRPTRAATDRTRQARMVRAAGDRYADIEIQSFAGFTFFTDDTKSLAEGMAPAFGTTPDEALDTPVALVGTVDDMISQIERRRERWDMTYHVVGSEVIDEFAPVVARLAGT